MNDVIISHLTVAMTITDHKPGSSICESLFVHEGYPSMEEPRIQGLIQFINGADGWVWFTLNAGKNLVHSCCQLCKVEAGDTMRNGPQIF